MSGVVFNSLYFTEIQNNPAKSVSLYIKKVIEILLVKYLFKNMILHFLEIPEICKYKHDNCLPFLFI